jgi:hypothetical protein
MLIGIITIVAILNNLLLKTPMVAEPQHLTPLIMTHKISGINSPSVQQPSGISEKQQEINKTLSEQLSSHTCMLEEMNKSIISIGVDIKILQQQTINIV